MYLKFLLLKSCYVEMKIALLCFALLHSSEMLGMWMHLKVSFHFGMPVKCSSETCSHHSSRNYVSVYISKCLSLCSID